MEGLAAALVALVLVGPYVGAVLAAIAAFVAISWGAFKYNRIVGLGVTVAMIAAVSWPLYSYLARGPSEFKAACESGIGPSVARKAEPDAYSLPHRPLNAGHAASSDATLRDAIVYVARGRVPYAEVQDWRDPHYPRGIEPELISLRNPALAPGYFKFYRDLRGAARCRWLLPEDVRGMQYESYLEASREHRLNEKLMAAEAGKECVAVDYVAAPGAPYAIEFALEQPVTAKIVRHEIRVVDVRAARALVGNSVAYEFRSEGVYDSAAFWIGTGKAHPKCPMNLLEGRPLARILGFAR